MTQLRDILLGFCKVTISVNGEDGVPDNCVVTVREIEGNSIISEFVYTEPKLIRIPPNLKYRIECSKHEGYNFTPISEILTASENTFTSVNLHYRRASRYGFKREKANSNPSARITYLYDAENMTPMSVDLSTGTPDYGSWQYFIEELCRPVMLKYDGTVDYELDHNN